MYLCVHFLSSRQRLIGRLSGIPWIQGREAAEMPGAKNASPSELLTASGKLFFITQLCKDCGRKIKSGILATCKIPDFPFFCHVTQTVVTSTSLETAHLPVLVHILIVPSILPAGDIVKPRAVVKIPADGLLDPLRELKARLPAKFILQL